MKTFYLQFNAGGRAFLSPDEPKPENLITTVSALNWKSAKKKVAHDPFNPRYVEGLIYREGYGYERVGS